MAGREDVTYSGRATAAQGDAALARASAKGAYARTEIPPDIPGNTILLIVVIGAAFVTLAGAAISIALSSAEGRADLATLAAVRASPRRRRALAASQALLIAGTGCALGVLAGTFVAYTLRATTGAPALSFPGRTSPPRRSSSLSSRWPSPPSSPHPACHWSAAPHSGAKVIRHGKGDRRRIAPINRHACAAIRVLGRRNRGAVRAAPARTPHTPRATRRAFVFGELGVDRTR